MTRTPFSDYEIIEVIAQMQGDIDSGVRKNGVGLISITIAWNLFVTKQFMKKINLFKKGFHWTSDAAVEKPMWLSKSEHYSDYYTLQQLCEFNMLIFYIPHNHLAK